MRVTNKSLSANYLNNLQVNLGSMQKYQNQLASGKEILKPSDNPYVAVRAMGMESVMAQNEQYKRNIADAQGWMDMTDSTLQEMVEAMNRFKTLNTQARGVLSSDASLNSLSEEMKQGIGRMTQLGNTMYDGRYIFGGFATTSAPFKQEGNAFGVDPTVNPDDAAGKMNREIAPAVTIPINVSASAIMNGNNAATPPVDDIGATMEKVYNTVKFAGVQQAPPVPMFNDPDTITAGQWATANITPETPPSLDNLLAFGNSELERHFDNIVRLDSETGAKTNRLETAMKRNTDMTLSMKELLSKIEDIDYVEKITESKTLEMVYQSALQVGSKILQNSLVNYLK